MIAKQDVLDRVGEWHLRPDVIEKDYVLGWVLAALSAHPEAGAHWVFKGGTCLKKCYFETFRFSEDLDFTLAPDAGYDTTSLKRVLSEVVALAYNLSGIEFPANLVEVRERRDKLGRTTFQGKIGYRGPLLTPFNPRILFDLTQHEPLQLEPVPRRISHPYPDTLPDEARALAYPFEEVVAEKVRALVERTRPRDLYDVVLMLENPPDGTDLVTVREVYERKCEAKGIAVVRGDGIQALANEAPELRSEWENMLAHQLPQLPSLDLMLERLPPLLWWMDPSTPAPISRLTQVAASPGSTLFAPPTLRFWGGGSPVEVIRFAGANRLMVRFGYHGRLRVAEPYSLRRATTGNVLLYAWERGAHHIKAYNLNEMRDVTITDTAFSPRYRIELSTTGTQPVPPAVRRATSRWSTPTRRPSGRHQGPQFIFRCSVCQREFRHTKNDPRLRRHKTSFGSLCSGRRGHLVRIG